MSDTEGDTEGTENFSELPDDGRTHGDDDAVRLAFEEKEYETRTRHLRKRMNRSTVEYENLKIKIADLKGRLKSPLPDPKICPQLPPIPPLPLKRRRRPPLFTVGAQEDEDFDGGGDSQRY